MKRVGLTIIVLALGLICFVAPVTAGEYRIGLLLPFTGPMAFGGQASLQGVEIARDLINERGGINGNEIVFVKADAPDPTAAATECGRLIEREKVKLIMGTYASGQSIAASAIADKANIFYYENGAASEAVTGRGLKNTFRGTPHGAAETLRLFKFGFEYVSNLLAIDPKAMKVIHVHEDGPYGVPIQKTLESTAQSLGYKVIGEPYSPQLTDLSSLILKVKGMNPDLIMATSLLNSAVLLTKQMKQYNFVPKAFIGYGSGFTHRDYIKDRGRDVDGFFHFGADFCAKALNNEGKLLLEEYLTRFRKKFNQEGTSLEAAYFSGAYILFKYILPKAGSLDLDKVRAAALALDIPVGSMPLGFGVKFDQTGQNTRAFLIGGQMQNMEIVTLYPAEIASGKPIMVPLRPWSERK